MGVRRVAVSSIALLDVLRCYSQSLWPRITKSSAAVQSAYNDNAKIDSRQATQMITYKLNHVSSPLAMKPERPNSIWRGDQLGRGADKANPAAKLEASRRIIATRHAFNI